jgi:hypothetical protein
MAATSAAMTRGHDTWGTSVNLFAAWYYAIKMLDEGKIPSRLVGKHRRARVADVLGLP